jgi:C4-dicarboxylate transporter DctM subunit
MTYLVFFLAFLGLVFGMPIAFVLGLAGLLILLTTQTGVLGWSALSTIAYGDIGSFILTAVPLFLFMGHIVSSAGLGDELYDVLMKWLNWLPGGLAVASVTACAGFGAISGSSVATAATVTQVAHPEMAKRGYDNRLIAGALAAGGTLGILIPPSIPLILYGSITEQSVGKLFIAGILPGMTEALIAVTYIVIISRLRPQLVPQQPHVTWKERFNSLRKVWTFLLLVVVVLGGIYLGVTTPTESAAAGALVSLILAAFVFKTLTWANLKDAVLGAAQTTAMVMSIIIGALIFGYAITVQGIPQAIAAWVVESSLSPLATLIAINLLMFFLGFFLEVVSIMLITLPIFFPIITALGFDPIWFGIVLMMNMELALVTPPVGLNLFVLKGVTGDTLGNIIKGTFPFMILEVLDLVLIIAFPQISLWLPSMMK